MSVRETYLGDGLYARFDGYMVILRALRAGGDHWVGLEPAVLEAFERFIACLRAEHARTDAQIGEGLEELAERGGIPK